MRASGWELLVRNRLGVPWATALLVAACVVTTLPTYFDHDLYLVIGTGHEVDRPTLAWWHPISAKFVHGGGWPGATIHLLINTGFFLLLGAPIERLLGAGRFMVLTGTALASSIVLTELLADGRGHGASGMTWSYLLFAFAVLADLVRTRRARALADPVVIALGLLIALQLLGLVNHWHRYNVVVSIPFFVGWRRLLVGNLEHLRSGQPPDRGSRTGNRLGILVAALLCVFTSAVALAAWLGAIR